MGFSGSFQPRDEDEPDEASRAARLRLAFDPRPERAGLVAVTPKGADAAALAAAIREGHAAAVRRGEENLLLIAPGEGDVPILSRSLGRSAALRAHLVATTPGAIRRLLLRASAKTLLEDATLRLWRFRPDLSARRLITTGQIAVLLLIAGAVAAAFALAGVEALAGLNLLAGLLFLAVIVLRVLSISLVLDRTARPPPPVPMPGRDGLPVYTVLVPLYDEGHMVADLVRALNRLDWPRDRLDIKFVVEARDRSTLAAIAALGLGAPFETIAVPPGRPRTKPKALAFALPLARGEFVTVFDAEDRPDPGQLIEAYAAFREGGPRLACVQAPLLIDNAELNGLTGLFAMEYSIQFDSMLPMLATLDAPLPLGGTSNHFRGLR